VGDDGHTLHLDAPLRLYGAAVDWLEPICAAAEEAVAGATRAALTRAAEQVYPYPYPSPYPYPYPYP